MQETETEGLLLFIANRYQRKNGQTQMRKSQFFVALNYNRPFWIGLQQMFANTEKSYFLLTGQNDGILYRKAFYFNWLF